MKIAIHTKDLDHERIDGTRVYIKNVASLLGKLFPEDTFFLLHGKKFNSELIPAISQNCKILSLPKFPFWTQTRFAWKIFKSKPDVAWLPMHNLPLLRSKKTKFVITVHDLAFKIFPEHFPTRDLKKLNLLADYAIKNADGIIAVSNSTKLDILKFYPNVEVERIRVIHHGFEAELFERKVAQKETLKILGKYQLQAGNYLLYVGAIQPRKNLGVLVEAFEQLKKEHPKLKLVLAGEKAWMWEGVLERIERSAFNSDVVLTGKVPFSELPVLQRNALSFVFPSIYEGFGIPMLEAFASGAPVIAAGNSSLKEVGSDAALYFDAQNSNELALQIGKIISDQGLADELRQKGRQRAREFSWEKCAKEAGEFLHSFDA